MADIINVVDIGSQFDKPLFAALESLIVEKLKDQYGENSICTITSNRKNRRVDDDVDFIIYVPSRVQNLERPLVVDVIYAC